MNATKKRLDYINQLVAERNEIDKKMSSVNSRSIKAGEAEDYKLWDKLNKEWLELYDIRKKVEKKAEKLTKKFLDDMGFELKTRIEHFYQVEDAVRYLGKQFEKAMAAFHTIYGFNEVFKNK